MEQFTIPTKYWHQLDDGRVQCDVCPRDCKLRDGQRGVCFVRAACRRRRRSRARRPMDARAGSASTRSRRSRSITSYPARPVLSFGTAGCNLACQFCQNWDISKSTAKSTPSPTRRRPKRSPRRPHELGCRSVAFTYNDPVIFLEYAIDVAEACRERGHQDRGRDGRLHLPPSRGATSSATLDAANVDLKAFTDDFYRRTLRRLDLEPVLETLSTSHETDVWFELTTLLIPGYERHRRRTAGAR